MMIQSLRLAGIRTRVGIIALLLAVQLILAFGAALTLQQFTGSAAPGSTISACVNPYTGAVRMGPTGATTCNANETKVSWVGQETLPTFLMRSKTEMATAGSTVITGINCEAGEVATGGGVIVPDGWAIHQSAPASSSLAPVSVPTGWAVVVQNPTADAGTFTFRVVCASQGP